ncbi:MAG: hypothetical protein HOL01_16650 [Planctomycetaceae bacterium]|jgi:hypothetical protein|nr:hypothetical protein [Planctomycetaceae bacterium]
MDLPWQSFQLDIDRSPAAVIRDLADSIPPCRSWEAGSYFCGTVDAATGGFTLYRSGLPKFRLWTPVLHGTLKPGDLGTTLEISIVPSFGFWLFLLVPLVFALPILIALVFQGPHVVFWLLYGFIWITFASCLSGPALLAHYLSAPRYSTELMRLVSDDGKGEAE